MSVRKVKNSQVWHYKFKLQGKEYSGSTRCLKKSDAIVEEARINQRFSDLLGRGLCPKGVKSANVTASTLLALVVDSCKRNGSKPDEYERNIPNLWDHIAKYFTSFNEITQKELAAFVDHLRGSNPRDPQLGNNSIARILSTFKRGLRLAKEADLPVAMPTQWPKIKIKKQDACPKRRGIRLHRDQLKKFLLLIAHNERVFTLVAFSLLTGLRATEMFRVKQSYVDRPYERVPKKVVAILRMPGHACKWGNPRNIGLTKLSYRLLKRLPQPFGYMSAMRTASKHLDLPYSAILRSFRKAAYRSAVRCGNPMAAKAAMGTKERDSSQHYYGADERVGDGDVAKVAAQIHKSYSVMVRTGVRWGVSVRPLTKRNILTKPLLAKLRQFENSLV